jgi:predicted transcriptional regulator
MSRSGTARFDIFGMMRAPLYGCTMREDASLSTLVPVNVPAALLTDLDRVAQALDRPRSWVILRALRAYLRNEGAEVIENAAALADLDRGEGILADDVLSEMGEIIDVRNKRRSDTP